MKKVIPILLLCCLCLAACAAQADPVPTTSPTQRVTPIVSPSPTPTQAPFALPAALEEGGESRLRVYDVEQGVMREMGVEDYLSAVVAGEMPTDFPEAALQAQAVVARTFLVNFLTTKGGSQLYPGADISTDIEESQAFDETGVNEAVRHAVEATRGIILTHNGQPIHAWFHAASGGKTASAAEGLSFDREPTPYIVPVDSDEAGAPEEVLHWEAGFSAAELAAALEQVTGQALSVTSVTPGDRGPSGRTRTLVISGTPVSANALRLALGSTRFRSTLLEEVSFDGQTLRLSGRGYGHGVGMAQWGARRMAQEGQDLSAILAHYYPGTKLTQAWE